MASGVFYSKTEIDTLRTGDAASVAATYRPNVRPRVGFIGDSITAGMANGFDPATGYSSSIGDSPAVHAMLASDGRWDLITNAGIGGQTSTQIAARLPDILALDCTVVVIASCYWNGKALGMTPAQVLADIQAMVTTCRAGGVIPVIGLPTPDGRSTSSTDDIAFAATLTQAVRNYATRNGVSVIDLAGPIIDPATGTIAAIYNADGSVHPNAAGYKALGLAVGATLTGILPPASDNLVRHAVDPTDLLAGTGMFLANGNDAGVGASWWLSVPAAGGTPSITTDSAVLGKMQRLTASSTTGALIVDGYNFTGWAVGDVLQLSGIITSSGGSASAQVRFVVGGSPNPNTYPNFELQAPVTRGRFSMLWKVPPGSTQIAPRLQLQGGSGYFEVGQLAVRNLTALGIA